MLPGCDLQTFYNVMDQGDNALRESQQTLLAKVEELSNQLKEETQKRLTVEDQLATATVTLQSQEEVLQSPTSINGCVQHLNVCCSLSDWFI